MHTHRHQRNKLSRKNYCPSPNASDIPVDVVVFVKKNGQHHQLHRHQQHHHKQHQQQQQQQHQPQQKQQQQHQHHQKQHQEQQQQQQRQHQLHHHQHNQQDLQQSQRQQQQKEDELQQNRQRQQERQPLEEHQQHLRHDHLQQPKQLQEQQQYRKTSAKGAKVISKYYDRNSDETNKIYLQQSKTHDTRDIDRIPEDKSTTSSGFVQSSSSSKCFDPEPKQRHRNPQENAPVRLRSIIVDDDLSHDDSNSDFIAVPTNWKCYKPSMYLIEKSNGFSPTDSAVKSSSDEDLLITEDDVFSVTSTPSKYYDSGVEVSDIDSPLRKISSNGSLSSIRSGHSDLDSRRSGALSLSSRNQVPSVIKRIVPPDVEVGINDASLIGSYIPNYYRSRLGTLKVDTSLQTNTPPSTKTTYSNPESVSRRPHRTNSVGPCHSSSSSSGVSSMQYELESRCSEDVNFSKSNPSSQNNSSQKPTSFREDTKSSKNQGYFIPVKEEVSTKKRKSRPINRTNSSLRRKNSHSGNCSGCETCGSSNRSNSKTRSYSSDHPVSNRSNNRQDRSLEITTPNSLNHENKRGLNTSKDTKLASDFRSVTRAFSDPKSTSVHSSSGIHPVKQGSSEVSSMHGEFSEANLVNQGTSNLNQANQGVSAVHPFNQCSSLNRISSSIDSENQNSSNIQAENREADRVFSESHPVNRSRADLHPLNRVSFITRNSSDIQSGNREKSKKTNRETVMNRGSSNFHTINRTSSAKRDSSSVHQKNRNSLDSHPGSRGITDMHNREPVIHPLHPDFNSELYHVNRGHIQHISDSKTNSHSPDRETKKSSRRSLRRSSSVCCDNPRRTMKKLQKVNLRDDMLKKNSGTGTHGQMYDIRNKNRAKSMPSLEMIGNDNYIEQVPVRTSEKKALISEKVLHTIRGTPTPHVYLPHSPNPTESQDSTLTDFADDTLIKSESGQSDSAPLLCSKPPTMKREKNQSQGPLRDLNTIMHDITNIKANLYSSLLNLHLLNESNEQILES